MNTMTVMENRNRKDPVINLPAVVVLTESGLEHCRLKSVPVKDILSLRGSRANGFSWGKFRAEVVQKMIINNFIESISVEKSEFVSRRDEVQDLTKLLFYGMIYRSYVTGVKREIMDMPQMGSLRTRFPGFNLLSEGGCDKKIIAGFFEQNNYKAEDIRNSLLSVPEMILDRDPKLDTFLKTERKHVMKKMAGFLDGSSLLAMAVLFMGNDRRKIMDGLGRHLLSYLKKTHISDYLGLLVAELIQHSERLQYENVAKKRKLIKEKDSIVNYLKDEKFRRVISLMAKQENCSIRLNYRIENSGIDSGKFRFIISVVYDGTISESNRIGLEKRIRSRTNLSLADYYYESDDDSLQHSLGIYYLSYLDDVCREQGIRFDAKICCDPDKGETEYQIILSF